MHKFPSAVTNTISCMYVDSAAGSAKTIIDQRPPGGKPIEGKQRFLELSKAIMVLLFQTFASIERIPAISWRTIGTHSIS